jgi:hypothetical protein
LTRVLLCAIATLLLVVLAACGGEEEQPVRIDWNLSREHTLDQVDWPEDRLDRVEAQIEPVASVRMELPGDEVFEMGEEAHDVILYRRNSVSRPLPGAAGRVIEKIEVYTEPLTVDDAYRQAAGYVEQFGLPRAPLDDWRERRRQGVEQATDRTTLADDSLSLGPDGPYPLVELNYSSDDERPWVVSGVFYWPPDEGGGAGAPEN